MPETIKTGNVATTGDQLDDNRAKTQDSGDHIPVLPLACWRGHESRVEECRSKFQSKFDASPSFYVRVPGRYEIYTLLNGNMTPIRDDMLPVEFLFLCRVNLIGEHIDYCGFGVFPMAIEHDVFILGRSSPTEGPSRLRLINIGSSFEDFECKVADIR